MSACWAVSDRKKSSETKNSSLSRASIVKPLSGRLTSGLKHRQSRPLISPAWMAFMISWADRPLPGSSWSVQPHTWQMWARCSGFSISRLPGSWSHLWPCSRPPWPLPWPVMVA